MNINWNRLQEEQSLLTTYTLIDDATNNVSLFVFNKNLESPILVQHLDGTEYMNGLDYIDAPGDELSFKAYVIISKFISNYIDHYSELHPSLEIPNLLSTFTILNIAYLDRKEIYTVNISLKTFVKLAEMWNPYDSWYGSDSEELYDSILRLNIIYNELNGNTNNPTIVSKVALLKKEASTPDFYANHPYFDILDK